MEEYLKKAYEELINNEQECIELTNIIDREVDRIFREYADQTGYGLLEEISGSYLGIICNVRREAYYSGAKHTIKLLLKILSE